MSDPFRIEGPALISFSGGRTSAYMLRRVLDAHDGELPPDVHAVFANTGKEREETLQFIGECARAWSVHVRWVEYRRHPDTHVVGFEEVGENSASRQGEPFGMLIAERKFLPNTMTRFCTQELKIRTMKRFMLAQGYEHWTNAVGIRADEPRRIARGRASNEARKERWESIWPLNAAGITKPIILDWWSQQPFDLRLKEHEGNCDLCFLKGKDKLRHVMYDRPDLADWWINHEHRPDRTFRSKHREDYAQLFATRRKQEVMAFEEDALDGCLCGVG